MLILKRLDMTPPGGWRYEIPETGEVIKALSLNGLVRDVRAKYAGVEPPNLVSKIQQWICEHQPSGSAACIQGESQNPEVIVRDITVKDVLSFINSVKDTVAAGGVVSKEEATRRASICATCPNNVRVRGCYGCNNISGAIFKVIGARATDYDSQLRQCGICGCDCRTKIWIAKEALAKNKAVQDNRDKYPSYCWQIK